MKCARARKSVYDYLDRLLSLREEREFEAHVGNCPDCKRFLASAERLKRLLKLKGTEIPTPAYWESFWPRLRETIRSEAMSPRPAFPRQLFFPIPVYRQALAAAVVIVILIFIGVAVFRRPSPPAFQVSPRPVVFPRRESPADYLLAQASLPAEEESGRDFVLSGTGEARGGRGDAGDFILSQAQAPGGSGAVAAFASRRGGPASGEDAVAARRYVLACASGPRFAPRGYWQ